MNTRIEMNPAGVRCDIFCNVIDNYGDIGVCWRLARQLANEHGLSVRLWVDDLASFAKLCPDADAGLERQSRRGVEVCHWTVEAFASCSPTLSRPAGHPLDETTSHSTRLPKTAAKSLVIPLSGEGLGEREVADIVIEAFACKLPESYMAAMAKIAEQSVPETKMDARRQGFVERDSTVQYSERDEAAANNADASLIGREPVWINLEYLSAEEWVGSHHKLPSPHPVLPLTKYFFFPGFTEQTGGLLLERDLLARRDAFQCETDKQQAFWKSMGIELPPAETLKISLFGYENAALPGMFDAWAASLQPILCLVPEGRILPQVGQYFGDSAPHIGSAYKRGRLHVQVLPFVEQERYDELLWACDANFVRGEDSFVRALWAGRPFVWQIYPQHDAAHLKKLESFLMLYGKQLSEPANIALNGMWQAWNGGCDASLAKQADREIASRIPEESSAMLRGGQENGAGQAWPAFISVRGELDHHTKHWARHLAENNLALNLLDFCREIGRMRACKIEGQQT